MILSKNRNTLKKIKIPHILNYTKKKLSTERNDLIGMSDLGVSTSHRMSKSQG